MNTVRIPKKYTQTNKPKVVNMFTGEDWYTQNKTSQDRIRTHTSHGKSKAKKADPFRTYEEYKSAYDYFLNKKNYRAMMILVLGVNFGFRVSDLVRIQFKDVMKWSNGKLIFRDRLSGLYEMKTGKFNSAIITSSVKDAITVYIKSINYTHSIDDYLFPRDNSGRKSKDNNPYVSENTVYKWLKQMSNDLGFETHISCHTLRQTMTYVALTNARMTGDTNMIYTLQSMLNHSTPMQTLHYAGITQDKEDEVRNSVNDFCNGELNLTLGKTNITKDNVLEKLMNILCEE